MAAFTYMGTKKNLAKLIGATCKDLPAGAFLDLFSGISAAGAAVAPSRHVWCNDAQHFSRTLTEALYLSSNDDLRPTRVSSAILKLGNINLNKLMGRVSKEVSKELDILWGSDPKRQISWQAEIAKKLKEWRGNWTSDQEHYLFTTTYAGTYFGLVQSLQIDSIRFGADRALELDLISSEEHRWALLAICRALAATSNSTGHFAQYLTPSPSNIARVLGKRRRCAWEYWVSALHDMRPLGDASWRRGNKVFHGDAVDVLRNIKELPVRPGIIYADPPYTSDQYSRYYHLFETALLYDYPSAGGKGLYRDGRFQSSFSLSRKVEDSFHQMICEASQVSGSLVISYPSNGLLSDPVNKIPLLMSSYFKEVRDPVIIPYRHSTMGGSKGAQKEDVEECIFVAVN